MFSICSHTESSFALAAMSRAAEERARLFEKGKGWFDHNHRAKVQAKRDLSIRTARKPLKRLDLEK